MIGIDAYSVYFPVRLFGENLKTDFAIVWFGDKAQTTFSASKDGTYIDVNAPVFSLSNDQYRVNVKVYIEVNESQFMTNSISVAYFRLSDGEYIMFARFKVNYVLKRMKLFITTVSSLDMQIHCW